jgi:hypothetical protein
LMNVDRSDAATREMLVDDLIGLLGKAP